MVPPRLRPMLAASGPIPGDPEDWAFEPKFDGWRAVVTVTAGDLDVRTRTGRAVADAFPELNPHVDAMDGRSVILDDELVAHDGDPSSFYRLGSRMAARSPLARSRRTPVCFVAFDCLWLDGDLTRETYTARREALESLKLQGKAWCAASSFPGAGAALFAACTNLGLEGVVAKRVDGRYYPG